MGGVVFLLSFFLYTNMFVRWLWEEEEEAASTTQLAWLELAIAHFLPRPLYLQSHIPQYTPVPTLFHDHTPIQQVEHN